MTMQCLWFSLWILLSRLLGWAKLLTEWKHMSHCYLPRSIDNGTPCLANVLLKRLLVIDFSQIYDFHENIVTENSFFKRKLFSSLDYNKQEGTGQKGKILHLLFFLNVPFFLIELNSIVSALILCVPSRSPEPDFLIPLGLVFQEYLPK